MRTSDVRAVALALFAAVTFGVAPSRAQQTLPAAVEGTFLGDGKDGKIKYVTALTREPFSDKPAIQLIFTEKNPASSKQPGFDAGFKKLGSALLLSVFEDGGVFGCEVAHTAHEKSPFSALGQIKVTDFKVTDTTVSGHVTTGGELDAFGQKWNVDLKFSTPRPKGAFAAASPPTPTPEEEKPEPPAGPKLPAGDLALPSQARDVEFKQGIEHIAFSSDAPVAAVAGEFSKVLKEQGWKDGPGNLVTKNNAILKRERDGAKLTIMVKPAGTGSTTTVFTEGLDWSDPPASAEPKPAKSGKVEDAAAEANRLINEALKQIPRGL